MKEEKRLIMKNEKVFAKDFCFAKVFCLFVVGSLFGTYYEEILWYIKYKEITNRQGLIYTPLSPIYGLGCLMFILFLHKNNETRSYFKTYLYCCLLGGFSEYLTSFIADFFFDVKFWDCSNKFLNINGRTTIIYMLGWGLIGLIFMKILYPILSKLIESIPYYLAKVIYYSLLLIVSVDLFLTYTAFGRMALRNKEVPPLTIVGKLYDKYYNNDFMYQKFPVMKPDEE